MHVDMMLTDRSFENFDGLRLTNLNDEFSTPFLNLAFQHVIAIFGHPHEMNRQSSHRVASFSLFCHDVLRQTYHSRGVPDPAQRCVAAKASR